MRMGRRELSEQGDFGSATHPEARTQRLRLTCLGVRIANAPALGVCGGGGSSRLSDRKTMYSRKAKSVV